MQRRRAWLGVLLGVLAVLAMSAGPASASLTETGDITFDGDVNWWNASNVVSHGDYQYVAFWDAADGSGNVYAKVVRRRLDDNDLDEIIFDGTGGTTAQRNVNVNDAHDFIQIGLSPNDGRVHISWSVHHGTHRYGMSAAGCMTQATFNETNCRFDWSRFMTDQRDQNNSGTNVLAESVLTYPHYFNDNSGNLYYSYRFGESFRGTQYLNSYNGDGTWTTRGRIFWGRRNAGDTIVWPGVGTARQRGVYHQAFEFDKNDRLHVMWIWKEYIDPTARTEHAHGLFYAYSDDHGGTWYNSAGTRVATIESDPFIASDRASVEVLSVPFFSWIGSSNMELDSDNRPHLVIAMSDPPGATPNYLMRHIWQGTDGSWYSDWATSTAGDAGAGDLMFDGADSAYYTYPIHAPDTWYADFSDPWQQRELRQSDATWQSDGRGGGYLDVQQYSSTTCVNAGTTDATAISSRGNSQVRFSLNNNTDATSVEVWFQTVAEPSWHSVDRMVTISPITANVGASYTTYTADFSRTADWTGTLSALSICTTDARADVGDQFKLDWVRVTNSAGTAAKSWEFDEQFGRMKQLAVAATNNWGGSWLRNDLNLASSVTSDSGFLIDKQRYKDSGKVNYLMLVQGAPGNERLSLREADVDGDIIRKDWRFDLTETEWQWLTDISSFRWSSNSGRGTIGGTLSGGDPVIVSADNLRVPVSGTDLVWVRMRNDTDARVARVWFVTERSSTWNSARSRDVTITARDRNYTWYGWDFSRTSGWSGERVRQIRIDPTNDSRVTTGSFTIDQVYIGE